MGLRIERFHQRQAAKQELLDVIKDSKGVVIIHYSSEGLSDRPDGASPRITSIAVRNLATAQTASFSIHQVAERDKVSHEDIEKEYNRLEKVMLDEFYQYVATHKESKWLHWNMRNITYGFAALAHRYRVLGGTPVDIHESNLFDLARLVIALYGPAYVGHPRLANLMKANGITDLNFLTGEEEADAFVNKAYVKLHQSTLRKVDVMEHVVSLLASGTIKTNATRREIYGSYIGYLIELLRDHPVMVVIAFVASIASILSVVLWFVR